MDLAHKKARNLTKNHSFLVGAIEQNQSSIVFMHKDNIYTKSQYHGEEYF